MNKLLKICFVLPQFHFNIYPLVTGLEALGHKVDFLVIYRLPEEEKGVVSPYQLPRHSIMRLWKRRLTDQQFIFVSPTALKRKLKELEPDLFVIRDPRRLFSLQVMIYAKFHTIPLVFYNQGAMHRAIGRKKHLLIRLLMKLFNAPWMTPVNGDSDRFSPVSANTFVVPFGLSNSWIETKLPYKPVQKEIKILMIAKYMERKNHLMLLNAIERLRGLFPVRITLIGGHGNPEYELVYQKVCAFLREKKMEGIVELVDWVPHDNLIEQYDRHNLFVLPSRGEEVGVSVLEAMGRGLPVICSNDAGVADYVVSGENGFLFNDNDPEDLFQVLKHALSLGDQLSSMGIESRRLVSERHTSVSVADIFLSMIRKQTWKILE